MKTPTVFVLVAAAATLGLLVVPAQAALVGYWSFDAGNAADASGNNNNGIVGSSITFGSDTPLGAGLSGQNYGGGVPNVITVVNSPTLESIDDQLTIAFWMKAVPGNDWVRLFQHGPEGGLPTRTWLVDRYSNANYTNVRVDTTAVNNQNIALGGADTFTTPATWHHLVYALNNGSWRKYVDGVETTGTYSHGDGLYNTNSLYIFGRNGYGEYVGQLDDVGLWSDAITVGQARSIYTLSDVLDRPYDLDDVMDLWALHAAADPSQTIGLHGLTWRYATLPGSMTPGDLTINGGWYLALTSTTGVFGTPEPSTLAMLLTAGAVGLLALLRRRRRS